MYVISHWGFYPRNRLWGFRNFLIFLLESTDEETFLRTKSHSSLGMHPGERIAGLLAATCWNHGGLRGREKRMDFLDILLESKHHKNAQTRD